MWSFVETQAAAQELILIHQIKQQVLHFSSISILGELFLHHFKRNTFFYSLHYIYLTAGVSGYIADSDFTFIISSWNITSLFPFLAQPEHRSRCTAATFTVTAHTVMALTPGVWTHLPPTDLLVESNTQEVNYVLRSEFYKCSHPVQSGAVSNGLDWTP